MFIYLSKKIAIPHNIKLRCISWNSEQGWIACGGQNGMLKVLKLESSRSKQGGNLSMNQTLEGHNGSVVVVTWNENYRKLSTSDQYGLIIVWMLHKGMWFEEMINNRNKSVVKDMKWTGDGQKICIVYEDGAVIVGSVDGNRLWGKELDLELSYVQWSPDGRNILFGTASAEVHVYDNLGNYISKLTMYAVATNSGSKIVGLQWYNGSQGYIEPNVPSLAVCFDNGRCQIMRDDTDDNPVLIDTGMQATQMQWNTSGTVLGISGTRMVQTQGGEAAQHMVQFYNPSGKHLRTLKVPGQGGITSLSWEGGSLRLALAVDSHIYFANLRPDYEWGYFSNTLVYSFNKADRAENCVSFWDTVSDERHIKYVKQLVAIRAAGENCVFATRTDDNSGQYILILCNAIGSPVDSKYIDIEPLYLAMTPNHVIVASSEMVYVWQYRTNSSNAKMSSLRNAKGFHAAVKEGRESSFHIDEAPDIKAGTSRAPPSKATNDIICCITASQNSLIIGRASGTLVRYSLPHLSTEASYVVRCRPQLLALNCNATRISIIDIHGIMTLFDLTGDGPDGPGKQLQFQRKDAWDMKWSDDNPELFACMEKTRMYVFRGQSPEEPVTSSGYLCSFSDLCIKAVLMDDIIAEPEHPDKDCIVNFETKSLRDTRELIASVPISEAFQFIEDKPHIRLWRILAESALEQLNFVVADKAFVRCSDYQGIQFVKRLKVLTDRKQQRAEVAVYFRRFDEAESIYLKEMDSKDLAVELRVRMGDWFRVVQLIQSGAGDDALLTKAFNSIGDYYADRQKWLKASKNYARANNLHEMVNCAYILDDYLQMEKLIERIPQGSEFLKDVGEKFMSVGLCFEAVMAFLKAGDPKAAIDCCVLLNQWDQAVELAEQHQFQQIEGLLTKYATHLLAKNKVFQAIELYRKAAKHPQAAQLLAKMGKQSGATKVNPLRAKKLYVLSALEITEFNRRMLDQSGASSKLSTQATLQTLLDQDAATSTGDGMQDPWHGAEAYHFYLMAQRQLYAGSVESAMKTALFLVNYEDVLDPKDIYSLIALTAYFNKFFGQASKALIRLECLEDTTEEDRKKFSQVAFQMFRKNKPSDPASRAVNCPSCAVEIKDFDTSCSGCSKSIQACVASGRGILNVADVYQCKTCRHRMYRREQRKYTNCPLCHSLLS